jgi:hypothetical protein
MRVFIGIDDTDARGWAASTARLARELGETLADESRFLGSVGHSLFDSVAATTNNKASCLVMECDAAMLDRLFQRAAAYVEAHAAPQSASGVVLACEDDARGLVTFGLEASRRQIRPTEAVSLLSRLRTVGRGARCGLIGAAAAVGLTARGWSGRWLELGGLRRVERAVQARELRASGIILVSLETDAEVPGPDDWVDTHGWLRPQLVAGVAALPLRRLDIGMWEAVGVKKR